MCDAVLLRRCPRRVHCGRFLGVVHKCLGVFTTVCDAVLLKGAQEESTVVALLVLSISVWVSSRQCVMLFSSEGGQEESTVVTLLVLSISVWVSSRLGVMLFSSEGGQEESTVATLLVLSISVWVSSQQCVMLFSPEGGREESTVAVSWCCP